MSEEEKTKSVTIKIPIALFNLGEAVARLEEETIEEQALKAFAQNLAAEIETNLGDIIGMNREDIEAMADPEGGAA